MKKHLLILIPFALAGCEYFQTKSAAKQPYDFTSKKVAEDQYEATIVGKRGASIDTLKAAFKAKGTVLCKDKVYLLRGMREESFSVENQHTLHGYIDCVPLDYFKESDPKAKGVTKLKPKANAK